MMVDEATLTETKKENRGDPTEQDASDKNEEG